MRRGCEPRFANAGLARKKNHLTFAGLNAPIAVRVLLFVRLNFDRSFEKMVGRGRDSFHRSFS